MIEETIAAAQVLRMADLRKFPSRDRILQLELVEALMHCDDEQHAVDVVSDWKYESAYAPTVADLRHIIEATAKPKAPCLVCGGHTWIHCEKDGGSFVKACPVCRHSPG